MLQASFQQFTVLRILTSSIPIEL